MKNKIVSLIVLMCFLAVPSSINAQFFKKLKNNIEKKTDKVLGIDNKESKENTTSESDDNSFDNSAEIDSGEFEPFKRGELVIFEDVPSADENVNEFPSKWRETRLNKNDKSEIVVFEGEKVIRVGERTGIAPIILENKNDYLPDNFTLEFDASFSANSGEQNYWVGFYDHKTQKDIVEHAARTVDLRFTTFAIMDGFNEGILDNKDIFDGAPNLVWRHISISYKNNTLDVYYDGEHLLRQPNIEGNFLGINISRSEMSDTNRYIKNIHLATNN